MPRNDPILFIAKLSFHYDRLKQVVMSIDDEDENISDWDDLSEEEQQIYIMEAKESVARDMVWDFQEIIDVLTTERE